MEVYDVRLGMVLPALTVLNSLNKEISLEESDINMSFHLSHLEDSKKERWHSLEFSLSSKVNSAHSTKIHIDFVTEEDLAGLVNTFTELQYQIKYNKL